MKLRIERVDFMPEEKEGGVLYVSEMFQLAIHNCPCGCGLQSVMPLGDDGWELDADTLRPSILNKHCGTHYWIRNGEVVWA